MDEMMDQFNKYMWNKLMGPIRYQFMNAIPSELPIYNILYHQNEGEDFSFGPGSDIVGCMVMEVNDEAGTSVAFMISSPRRRVEVGGNWNYALDKAWKARIKEFLHESINQYDGESSVIVHWDPYSDSYRKINQTYLCEYVEEITGRASFVTEVLDFDINQRWEKKILGNEFQHRRDS